jgi:hypothetical protein
MCGFLLAGAGTEFGLPGSACQAAAVGLSSLIFSIGREPEAEPGSFRHLSFHNWNVQTWRPMIDRAPFQILGQFCWNCHDSSKEPFRDAFGVASFIPAANSAVLIWGERLVLDAGRPQKRPLLGP